MFLYKKFGYIYNHIDIHTDKNKAINDLAEFLKIAKGNCNFICFDTETDGLSIITSKPFLVAMGFKDRSGQGYVVTFDYDSIIMSKLWSMYQFCNFDDDSEYIGLFAHNAKYDYHMMMNGGSPLPYSKKMTIKGQEVNLKEINLFDSITIARLTEYADSISRMSLEYLGEKYVDDTSKFAGKIIKDLIIKIRKERKDNLKKAIADNFPDKGLSTITKTTGKIRYTKAMTNLLEDYEKKKVKYVNDKDLMFEFIDKNYKEPNYQDVYEKEPELMRSYAADDIVIEIEYMCKATPPLKNIDNNLTVMKRESKLIRAVADMEKVGLKIDIDYVLNCRNNVLEYRNLLYFELEFITDEEFSVGQHDFIKKLLNNKYGIKTDKSDEKALKYIINNSENEEVKFICKNILELRTLDKWLSTYIDGKLNDSIDGRIYTDINNNGAISGRVSCNMQQQPKEPLKDRNGVELFHPRKLFVVDDDYCFAFVDQSQMELRVQAYYTILCGSEPDRAMCRAYMPYDCYKLTNGGLFKKQFDYTDVDDLNTFNDYKWFKNEDNEEWHPTDLHSETTSHAFPGLDVNSDEFKKKRKLGKRANFLKVYQGGVDALMDSLEISRDLAETLSNAFYKAFPRIRDYQEWVNNTFKSQGYVENLYGRRYYMQDKKWYYKGCNYLIQGTCADMLKDFEIKIWNWLKEKNLKSKMVLPIHDEIMLLVHKDEMFVIEKVKEIMEDVKDVIKYVPMIAEPEVSYMNWANKEEFKI